MMTDNRHNIRASELRQWDLCPRQWYLLRTTGRRIRTQASLRGREFHRQQSVMVKEAQKSQSIAKTFFVIGGIACLLWLLSHLS